MSLGVYKVDILFCQCLMSSTAVLRSTSPRACDGITTFYPDSASNCKFGQRMGNSHRPMQR